MTKKTKEEILQDCNQELEMSCINIFENLQANELTLKDYEILDLANEFYKKMHIQNNKVIVTGDGKFS